MSEMPDIYPGYSFTFGNGARAVVRTVYKKPEELSELERRYLQREDGAVLSAVIGPHNPAAYSFAWKDGQFDIVGNDGGSYVRPGHPDWQYAVMLREKAGIKNPHKY